jgi:hypothetical protein
LYYVGNLTGIYDVSYFGKISYVYPKKTRLDALAYDSKKIKVAKPVPESLAFTGFRKIRFLLKFDLIKYNLRFTEG